MSKLRKQSLILAAALIGAAVVLPSPAAAQFSDSYKFLEAVRKKSGDTDGYEILQMLDKGGPNLVNTRDQTTGETPLEIAVRRHDLTMMKLLMARGANVNLRDFKGVTPLVAAVNVNFMEGVELLVGYGAHVDDSNDTGETPLITAVHNRNIALMRVLLKAGANPDRTDNSGRSARDYAKLDGSSALLGVIESDARPKAKQGPGSQVYGPKF